MAQEKEQPKSSKLQLSTDVWAVLAALALAALVKLGVLPRIPW
jgi:hypothetical protein